MTVPSLAITGVTGQIGRLVATHMATEGRAQRFLVRAESVARAPDLPGAQIAHATYGDYDAARAALDGIALLLMVSAAESADRVTQHRSFIDAAKDAGVRHIVYTSFLGASPQATFTLARDHWATEEHIRASGMAFTFLRDSMYLDFLPLLAGADGVIRGPAGNGVLGAVARADVARSAVAVLTRPEAHAGKTYNLTGREALSLDDVARIVASLSGKATTYHNETIAEAYASRAQYNAPSWQVDAWVSTYTAIANGDLAEISDAVKTLTGRQPMTLREYLANADSSSL